MKSISEIKEKIKPGDITTAAAALGLSQSNASKALHRANSKHHLAVVRLLSRVIETREKLINANNEA